MKKLSPQRKAWQVRLAKRCLARRIARRRAKAAKAAAAEWVTIYQQGRRHRLIFDGVRNLVPARLHLWRNWDETAGFLAQVREGLDRGIDKETAPQNRGRGKKRRSRIWEPGVKLEAFWDFASVKLITIPVALILASQYDRSREISDWTPFAVDIDLWNRDVRSLLRAIGFLDLAGVEQARKEVNASGAARVLRMQRGQTADGEAVVDYLATLGIDVFSLDPRLMDAIMEAVTNCVHHAYKDMDQCEAHTLPSWWLHASVEQTEEGQRLRIIVYDHGASIPRTLPSWERFPIVQRQLAKLLENLKEAETSGAPDDARFDGDAIRIALEVGQSSTAEQNRGKGLDQIVRALDLCERGTVYIHSRRGSFSARKEAGSTRQKSVNRGVPIIGTMVYWDLMINAVSQ